MLSSSGIGAAVLAAAGIVLVRMGWQARRWRGIMATGGAAAVTASTLVWAGPSSVEQRVALTLLVAMTAALGLLGLAAASSEPRRMPARARSAAMAAHGRSRHSDRLRCLALGVLHVLIAGISALALSAGLFAVLRASGAEGSATVAVSMLMFPLSWGSLLGLAGLACTRAQTAVILLAPGLAGVVALALV